MNWLITNRQLRRELDRLQMRDAARCSEHQRHVERLQSRISGLTAELKARDERAGLT